MSSQINCTFDPIQKVPYVILVRLKKVSTYLPNLAIKQIWSTNLLIIFLYFFGYTLKLKHNKFIIIFSLLGNWKPSKSLHFWVFNFQFGFSGKVLHHGNTKKLRAKRARSSHFDEKKKSEVAVYPTPYRDKFG
jgi:hypothetical protein